MKSAEHILRLVCGNAALINIHCYAYRKRGRIAAMRKIVLNALPYKQESSGIGVMIRELFGAYAEITRRPCTFILSNDSPLFPGHGTSLRQVRSPYAHRQGIRRMWFQSFKMGRKYCENTVLLTTDSKTPFFLPENCLLAPLITDLALFRMPEVYQFSRIAWWRIQYWYVKKRADLFLTVSEFTKQEMMALWNLQPEKIRVVPCACPPHIHREEDPETLASLRERYVLPKRFILFVGNSNPRKNLRRVIAAFDHAKGQADLPHQLIIAGEQGWKFDRKEAVRSIRYREDVRFIGFIPDADMSALYTAADLFIFPTLYEGFGIPVLEAQTCGTPVLTSNCTSLPEVAGDGAVYVNPYSEEDICKKMLEVLQNPELQVSLKKAGYENVTRYSWIASAKILDEVIEEKLGKWR